MQRTELERRLRKGGWVIVTGGKHNRTYHPDNPSKWTIVPRGSQVNDITAKQILKFAGLL